MRVEHLNLRATVGSRSEAVGLLAGPGDAVLIYRERPRVLLLKCPSGCGEEIAVNLDVRAGRAWRLYQRRGATTLHPSVWRDSGCECHFIIWKDEIYVFDSLDEAEEERTQERLWSREVGISRVAVLGALSYNTFESYVDVADRLDAVPWEVLIVCRRLVREGAAVEGSDDRRGHFARVGAR